MNRFLLVVCFLFISATTFGQQFSQYNTGTLFDSFENPAQTNFIPDSSRYISFNFLVPNFGSNFFLTGHGQVPLKTRAFTGRYVNTNLTLDKGDFSRANVDANTYLLMLRIFKSLDGDQEMGFSVQTRAEGKGIFTDQTLLLLNGAGAFQDGVPYNDLNNSYRYQAYHQISFAYREKFSKQFSFGFKLSALLGIQYQRLNINSSYLQFDNAADNAYLGLQGNYRISYTPGKFSGHDLLPNFRNPGASISIGTRLQTRDNFVIQANIKDLGFIHWYNRSTESVFNDIQEVPAVSEPRLEDKLYKISHDIVRSADRQTGFTTPTNAKFELSANKSYWLDNEMQLKYSPTLIVQKELFYDGYTAALSNPIQYKNFTGTFVASYNNYKLLNAGLQFMVRSPNAEFFIGSDRLLQSASLAGAAGKSESQIAKAGSFSGADFFMGFSLKFGHVIEHPLNTSVIPIGDRPGLLRRMWNGIWGIDNGD
ncbi:hypothetical protein D0C36_17695 [Mucilaginibacter conchicola]|uniref:DUF5723 domain-containing protein n=1 Tax=Mucilaginibacter conchicola TaxID=2303333 RepID=A0A372NQ81_9SPHI|nr:DUF5723 family protein [Mucilaginibacter conchicola]RFZ90787.1 hypothetical protein D0C36_17695 [Mucilaginibacter conchicola]